MGRSHDYRISEGRIPHFLTSTVLQWLPLFAQPANTEILLDSRRFLESEGRLAIQGYVIVVGR